jgi:hypothetical protein
VLQNAFSDLHVTHDSFNVILSFDKVKERITVPFDAITEFADPSVNFKLKLNPPQNQNAVDGVH